MKKYLLIFSALLSGAAFVSAEVLEPIVVPDAFGQKISKDGRVIIGQTADGSAITFDWVNSIPNVYWECYPGIGNCYSDNDIFVGETMEYQAIIMKNGSYSTPETFEKYILSSLHGITRDGSRACGYVESLEFVNNGEMLYKPIYCEIDANGNAGEPQFLPTPEKDFFGAVPQYCSAMWISDDGKVIVGQVVDATGFYSYPIIYKEDTAGNWEYVLPSERFFNMDNLPVVPYPGDFMEVFPDIEYPEYTNYMSPEKKEEFLYDLSAWEAEDGSEANNPWNYLTYYMTDEEIEAYNECVYKWNEAGEEYNRLYDEWVESVNGVVSCSIFFGGNGNILSPDGKTVLMLAASYRTGLSEEYDIHSINYYNVETDEFTGFNPNIRGVYPRQLMNDGTIIFVTPMANLFAGGGSPSQSYIKFPDSDEMISAYEYIRGVNPYYANWMEENLTGEVYIGDTALGTPSYAETLAVGGIAVSDDFSVISSGVEGFTFAHDYDYFTYILADMEGAGVGSIVEKETPEIYRVYNLHGVNVLNTKEKADVNNLSPGIYIVNGKKVVIR